MSGEGISRKILCLIAEPEKCCTTAILPKVWKMTSWKVPSAGRLILQLPTAQAGPRKLY